MKDSKLSLRAWPAKAVAQDFAPSREAVRPGSKPDADEIAWLPQAISLQAPA